MALRQKNKIDLALIFVLAGVGGLFLLLNLLTPMAADDFFYACRLGYAADGTLTPLHRLQNAGEIVLSQKCVYMAHSGRLPVLAAVQLFTLFPGWVFDLCNTLAFLLLLWLLARLSASRPGGQTAMTILGAGLLLWQCTPALGQDLLWQTGALNYLWTMTATLGFLRLCLLPQPAWQRRPYAGILYFALGLASGWSMENQSAAACCLCAVCLFVRRQRERRLPRPLAAGAAGQLLGFALLMAAPGNYRRSAGYGQSGLPAAEILPRLVRYTAALWAELGGLILLAALLTLLVVFSAPQRAVRPLWLLGGAAVCHLSMAMSPSYPLRSMFGGEVLLVGALLASLNALAEGRLLPVLCALLGLCLTAELPEAAADLAALHTVTTGRAAYILEQRDQGNRDLIVPVAAPATRFNPLWGDALSDLMQDPNNERNRALALYYEVDTIRGDPALQIGEWNA